MLWYYVWGSICTAIEAHPYNFPVLECAALQFLEVIEMYLNGLPHYVGIERIYQR